MLRAGRQCDCCLGVIPEVSAVPSPRCYPRGRQGVGWFWQAPLSPQEHESLEQENTALRREIGALTEERLRLSEALREHEKRCPLLLSLNFPSTARPDPAGCLPR